MKSILKIILVILFTSQLFSQSHLIKSNGDVINVKLKSGKIKEEINEKMQSNRLTGTLDTLSYNRNLEFDVNFGFSSQDVLIQWFQAPADMTIKEIGFRTASEDTGNSTVSIMLIKSNWNDDSLQNINVPKQMGYYESDGENAASYFYTETTGEWIDLTEGEYPSPPWSGDYDDDVLWTSDQTIIPDAVEKWDLTYQFVETSTEGFEPEIEAGTILGIMLIHNGQNQGENRIDIWADQLDDVHYGFGLPGWKYYHAGNQAEPGWWAREYVFDFALAVDFPSGPHLYIYDVTQLTTTTSTDSMLICCSYSSDNPSGGPSGVETIELVYTVNSEPEISVEMEHMGEDRYCAYIPGQEPGDTITYWIAAADKNGDSTESLSYSYRIFKPDPAAEVLFVFNNPTSPARAEQLIQYYMKHYPRAYDEWYYEELTIGLLEHYSTVIELSNPESTPEYNNRGVISEWLDNGNKNYMLIGQEMLGVWSEYRDSLFKPGDFEYEYLGIQQSFNDVSYNPDNQMSLEFPSYIKFQEQTVLGDSAYQKQKSLLPDSLWYDPAEILGSTANNWLDQFTTRENINGEIFVTGYDWRMIQERPVGHNFVDDKGNKIVFMSFDPLAVTSETYWLGDKSISPFNQALYWFDIRTDVIESDEIPQRFYLSQNYPNPFNPGTTIKYTIPLDVRRETSNVRLVIYDILGREIKTLINEPLQPGSYEVKFEGTGLPSGVYLYRLTLGEFSQTRKMLLMK